VRRAFPYVEASQVEPLVAGHGEALYKLAHTAPFTVGLQVCGWWQRLGGGTVQDGGLWHERGGEGSVQLWVSSGPLGCRSPTSPDPPLPHPHLGSTPINTTPGTDADVSAAVGPQRRERQVLPRALRRAAD
jgi:hypothetical protein